MKPQNSRLIRVSTELDNYLMRDLELLRQDLERLGIKKRVSKTAATKLLAKRCEENGIHLKI